MSTKIEQSTPTQAQLQEALSWFGWGPNPPAEVAFHREGSGWRLGNGVVVACWVGWSVPDDSGQAFADIVAAEKRTLGPEISAEVGGLLKPATIEARWVAAGVGLPTMWKAWHPAVARDVDLTDPQTAFGVALQLDIWEIVGGIVWNGADSVSWVERVAFAVVRRFPATSEAMAARVAQIGMDNHIRRSLGWDVEPGTLATLIPPDGAGFGVWVMEYEKRRHEFASGFSYITDPTEALRVIAEAP